ncbi:hypothetical protein VVMO6_02892 [Vibrio vulnificus MO6-24/O]|nr:hypothetical protein VVMO6_02892 [Vibrio vulnificus MO6-24/O]
MLSMPKGVVRHLPDDFWLSIDFLYHGLLPKPDPLPCLNL